MTDDFFELFSEAKKCIPGLTINVTVTSITIFYYDVELYKVEGICMINSTFGYLQGIIDTYAIIK